MNVGKNRCLLHFFTSFCLLALSALYVQAGEISPDLQAALQKAPPDAPLRILVSFRDQADLKTFSLDQSPRNREGVIRQLHATAERSQARVRTLISKEEKTLRNLWIINAIALKADSTLIHQLAVLPEVREVRLDAVLHQEEPVIRELQNYTTGWNLDMVNAPELWEQNIRGQGTVVAIIDSGVDGEHPELGGRWRGGPGDWFNPVATDCADDHCTACETQTDFPCDDVTGDLVPSLGWLGVGHGTAVAGIAVGEETGVAPEAKWIAAKVFDDEDNALTSNIHAALQWALDPDGNPETDDSPDVVNASWGFDSEANKCIETFRPDVQALKAAGISVIFAAGNFDPPPAPAASSISPANYPESFAVGAIDPHRIIADFSSRGPSACDDSIYPELVAPGVAIETLLPTQLAGDPYITISGTSFSAPHVSGAIALLCQVHPEASPSRLEKALMDSAVDLGNGGADNAYGYGLLHIAEALNQFNAPPPSPILLFPEDGATDVETTVAFQWKQENDPNGDPVENTLLVGENPASLSPLSLAGNGEDDKPLLAAVAGMMILSGLGSRFRTPRKWALVLFLGVALLLTTSCGGGDGDGSSPPPIPAADFKEGVAVLQPNTTYYWQVVAEDSYGATSESAVYRFTTRGE